LVKAIYAVFMETSIATYKYKKNRYVPTYSKGNQINTGDLMMDSIWNFAAKVMGMLLVFIAPIKSIMWAVGFLVIVDLITGIWAAKKRGEKITSNGLRNTASKTLAYLLLVFTSHVVQSILVPEIPLVKVVSALIGVTEVKSFFENIEHITGLDVWSEVLKKLHGNKKVQKLPKKRK